MFHFATLAVIIPSVEKKAKPPARLRLQSRISIIIALAVICVVSVSTYIATLLTPLPVVEEIYRKTLSQSKLTAQQLVRDQMLDDPQNLLRTLYQMQSIFPGVRQADVYLHHPKHTLVATTDPKGEHVEIDNVAGIENYNEFERIDNDQFSIETPDGKYWIISTLLREHGAPIGCLNLKVSKAKSNVIALELVKQNLVLMLASLTVLIVVIHLFFLRSVGRPVKEMIRVMEATEGGQLDARAHVASLDEIGELAEHLNRMLARIENFNTELSRKVNDATAELARRNDELWRINEELFETQKTLARSERLAVAGQLAASLAHEIGTPLNSISGHVQLLARRKTGDEVTDRRLQIIEKQIENIVRTVKQLLAWTSKFDLRITPVDLRRVLDESILLSSPALEFRKIKTRLLRADNIPKIYGDAGYLQQVFLNLINNSMDAMPKGGEILFQLSSRKGERNEVAIEISDNGEGINPENLAHIFEPMFTTKRMGTGAGLGLAICDQIVRQHGGAIQVESEVKHGTRFTIVLPVDGPERIESAGAGVDGASEGVAVRP